MFVVFAEACTHELNIPLMHAAKGFYSTNSFFNGVPRMFIPTKYTRYTVHAVLLYDM